jgi:hypothetical protein
MREIGVYRTGRSLPPTVLRTNEVAAPERSNGAKVERPGRDRHKAGRRHDEARASADDKEARANDGGAEPCSRQASVAGGHEAGECAPLGLENALTFHE